MLRGFRQFVLRGNVIDLAIAVVIGAAFGTVVSSFVKDLLTPLIAAIGGKPDFSAISFTINGSRFLIGDFVNAVLSFLIVSAAVYFGAVVPMSRFRPKAAEPQATRKCPECLSEVPMEARRCAHCSSAIGAVPVQRTGT